MRAYVAITPSELQNFLCSGSLSVLRARVVDSANSETAAIHSQDQEELEFETSWEAAEDSKAMQGTSAPLGFVLAVDLEKEQAGEVEHGQVGLHSDLVWSQVQSLLLSESEEPELSWFAAQEISTYLPQWLA